MKKKFDMPKKNSVKIKRVQMIIGQIVELNNQVNTDSHRCPKLWINPEEAGGKLIKNSGE